MAAQTTAADARPEPRGEGAPVAAANTLDEDDRTPARWERAIGWAIVAIAMWLVWCILDANHDWGIHFTLKWNVIPTHLRFTHFRFGDLFANTTTNGGDMGAHVWWPQFLEKNWFPKLRVSGWAPDWYAGFPVGQYYFPLPAIAIAILDHVPGVPYNVAFKLVTVSGPLMLPAAAYSFARGLRAPWPAPPAFALAGLGLLVETRDQWQIYGGNIASTLAGEFSFSIGLAFALFGLGALAKTLDTGRRRWLPAVLIAAAIMSHIVVAIFIAVAAILLWLTRRPLRTFPLAVAIGAVAVMIPMVWLLPLLGNQAYTQSMRYTKLVPGAEANFHLGSWFVALSPISALGPVHHTITDLWRNLNTYTDPSTHKAVHEALWLPWWMWLLSAVAIVAAGWYRRRSTLVLLVLAITLGVMFVEWPEHAIWNTRFLPFWLLTWGFIAAMGAAELARLAAMLVRSAYRWIRDGDLQDARARAWAEIATSSDGSGVAPEVRKEAAWVLAERRFDTDPEGWEPPAQLAPTAIERRGRTIMVGALTAIVVLGGGIALNRAWDARDDNPSIAITGWAQWNYSGYERKAAYPQYKAIMDGMNEVADTYGNGRALWEPSSGDPDAINSYGTSLALELLPLFTHGRIDSMEGIYFESAATTDYHFLTVAECAQHPSNPVRGLKYGTLAQDFDLCVRHLQMMGVRYLMLWTPEANAKAAQNSDLTLIKTIPGAVEGTELKGWKVYEVANSDLVVGLSREPVVAKTHGGTYSKCWNDANPDPSSPEPYLPAWECATAPWWETRSLLDTLFTQTGPKDWQHVDASQLADVHEREIAPATVSNVSRDVDSISFHVSEVGKPVLVRESYFPNWHVSGAKGPYRVSPNFMVVVPTRNDVTLTYGLSKYDWAGRVFTIIGLIGLVFLGRWKAGRRFAADDAARDDVDAADERHDGDGEGSHGDDDAPEPEPPPDQREPAPALP